MADVRTGPSLTFMADWEIRQATAADLDVLVGVRAVVMRPDLERLGRYDAARVRQRMRDAYEPGHTWAIEVAGALAGCVALRPAPDAYWLEHFYLEPRLQGTGIGTAVLRELLARADREGGTVRLNVLQGSPARRLYERFGFVCESQGPVDVFMVRAAADRVARPSP